MYVDGGSIIIGDDISFVTGIVCYHESEGRGGEGMGAVTDEGSKHAKGASETAQLNPKVVNHVLILRQT